MNKNYNFYHSRNVVNDGYEGAYRYGKFHGKGRLKKSNGDV